MKRKMTLIHKILEWTESHADGDPKTPPEIQGYQDTEVNYHIGLCLQAGYLEADYQNSDQTSDQTYKIINLTWDGHEVLDPHPWNS